MSTRIQQKRGTAAQWTSANTVLLAGEIGVETDTNKTKIGDGLNSWNNLPYYADPISVIPTNSSVYIFPGHTYDSTFQTVVANRVYFSPMILPASTVDGILIKSANDTGSSIRLGLYSSLNNKPYQKIMDAGTVSITQTSTNYLVTTSQEVTPGLYWAAASSNASFSIQGGGSDINMNFQEITPIPNLNLTSLFTYGYMQSVSNGIDPLPNFTSNSTILGASGPRIALRIIS